MKKIVKGIIFCIMGLFAAALNTHAMPDLQTMYGPHYITDDTFAMIQTYENSPIISGWDADVSGGTIKSASMEEWFRIRDTSSKAPVKMSKKLRKTENCTVTVETSFKMMNSSKNSYFRLSSGGGEKDIFRLSLSGGKFHVDTKSGTSEIQKFNQGVFYGVKLRIDLNEQKYDFWLDGKYVGNYEFKSDTHSIDFVEIATGTKERADIYMNGLKIHTGFAMNEQFFAHTDGSIGEDWEVYSGIGTSAETQLIRANPWPDYYSAHLTDSSSVEYVKMKKKFEILNKHAGFECKFTVRDDNQEFNIRWTKDDKSVFELSSKKNAFYLNGEKIYDYVKNVWYIFSIEADFRTKKADIYLNNRILIEDVPFSGEGVNGFEAETGITKHSELWLDDILAYEVNEPESYVPEPVINESKDFTVGVQTCDMWRDGQHLGWDYSLTQPERIPMIGLFDDGSREAADWDIKNMVECGIDYRLTCWFVSRNYKFSEGPMKMGSNGYGLLDGYMRAKYSDKMKYSILWENAASTQVDAETFKTYIVPYWIEYFIKDPRFLVIDNKPVIYLYLADYFYKYQCGEDYELARECLNYLREECRKLGFDGCTIIASRSSQSQMYAADIGCDGIYNYSFNATEMVSGAQITNLANAKKQHSSIFVQPTVSMGNEASAWLRAKGAYSTVETFKENLISARDDFFKDYSNYNIPEKLVMLATWNEYNEGHYIAPCGKEGFGYLDAVREVFTDCRDYTPVLPTEEEKRNYCILFPENRIAGMRGEAVTVRIPDSILKTWEGEELKKWTVGKQIESYSTENGVISGMCSGMDPSVMSEDNLGINIDNATYVRVRIKQDVTKKELSLFFITDDDIKWNEAKGITLTPENAADGYYDVYFPVWSREGWKGTLKQLRIDPLNTTGGFSIQRIDLLQGNSMDILRIKLDGELLPLVPSSNNSYKGTDPIPVLINGKFYMPMSCYQRYFGIKMVYIPGLQMIKAVTENALIEISVSDGATSVNGETVGITPLEIYGGQYVIPLREVMESLGYKVEWDNETCVTLVTSPPPALKPANADPDGVWNFNEDDDLQNWTTSSQISNASVSGGILSLTTSGTDPQLYMRNISFDASKYKVLKLRVKNMTKSTVCELFFTTEKDSALNAAKSYKIAIEPNNEDFVEYEVDLTNPLWKGTVTQLRLDPVTAAGNIEIDYIMLCNE